MKILVVGGTRFFGIPMVNALLFNNHEVTIATRGLTKDPFGNRVKRILFDRRNPDSVKEAFKDTHFDVVIDKIAYSSNDVKRLLDVVSCDRYILMSSTAVYDPLHMNTLENEFDGHDIKLQWLEREDAPYSVGKQQAEAALCQAYEQIKWTSVRYPVVLGMDDYTKRMEFYVEHISKQKPMNIDNLESPMSFICSREAGEFLAWLVEHDVEGPINGASAGTVSLGSIIAYIEHALGKKAVLSKDGDDAPYNGTPTFCINTERAQNYGYEFENINNWIFHLLDKILLPERLPGVKKKSFVLPFNNGEIWFEHLDGMYQYDQLVRNKLKEDSKEFLLPSKPSAIGIVLDETNVTNEIADDLISVLLETDKVIQRVCFIGTDKKIRKMFVERLKKSNKFQYNFINDLEKAKEWLIP